MQYDVRLKAIFQEAMPGLLRLLGLPAALEYLTVEFPKKNKSLPDLVVRLVDASILHVELQSQNDSEMVFRNLDYWLAVARQWRGARIHQVVIYLGDDRLTMDSSIREEDLQYRFEILNPQEVPASAFLESESDKELAILCQTDDPRATISRILGSWKHLPPKVLRERLESLTVLSQLKKRDILVREVTDSMPIELDIRENAFFKWGAEEGEVKGEAKVISRILERRFGPLAEPILSRIAAADIETLDRWADRLDSASTLDAVFSD